MCGAWRRLALSTRTPPGSKLIENAMALVTPPVSAGEDIEVRQDESLDGSPVRVSRWRRSRCPRTCARSWPPASRSSSRSTKNSATQAVTSSRWSMGEVSRASSAVAAAAGLSLFGGAVLPDARGARCLPGAPPCAVGLRRGAGNAGADGAGGTDGEADPRAARLRSAFRRTPFLRPPLAATAAPRPDGSGSRLAGSWRASPQRRPRSRSRPARCWSSSP